MENNEFEIHEDHIYTSKQIPTVETFYSYVKKDLVMDDVIYKIRNDGIVIEGKIDKKTLNYYPFKVLESFTFNFKFKKNTIAFELKEETQIHRFKNNLSWVLFEYDKKDKDKINNFLSSKLTKIMKVKYEHNFLSYFLILIIFVYFYSSNSPIFIYFLVIPYSFFILHLSNMNYR